MHDRFLERCVRNPEYADTDSLVWCRKAHEQNIIRLKPVSYAADEVVLAWLHVEQHGVRLQIEILEDFIEFTSTYHDIAHGPVKVDITVEDEKAKVTMDTQQNPALVKLCLSTPTQAHLDGEHVRVRIVTIESMYRHPDWTVYVMCNGQERASGSFSKICHRHHHVLVECDVPDSHVLFSSEQAFTCIINRFHNSDHACVKWDATPEELESEDFDMFFDAPLEECLENYKQIFDLDKVSRWSYDGDYDIQGVVERIPLHWIQSVWHTYDGEVLE